MNPLLMSAAASLLLLSHTSNAQTQLTPQLRERSLADSVLSQQPLPDTNILQQREWAAPLVRPRIPAVSEKPDAVSPAPTISKRQTAPRQRPAPPALPAAPLEAPLAPPGAEVTVEVAIVPSAPSAEELAAQAADQSLASGWASFEAGALDNAEADFTAALGHHPGAAQGLALIALRRQRLTDALRHAEAMPSSHPERAKLLRTIRLSIAWEHLAKGEQAALEEFAALYREKPEPESAEGLVNAARRFDRFSELDTLANSEPLASLYRRQRGEMAFADKRFLLARQLDTVRYGELGTHGTSSAGFSLARRIKETPTLRTSLTWQPAAAFHWQGKMGDQWSFHAEKVRVDVGLDHVRGLQARLDWRHETPEASWEAALGSTPDAGTVKPALEGLFARTWHLNQQHVRVSGYRQSVKDSATSYVGHRGWGRVLASGLQGEWRGTLFDRWSGSFTTRHEWLDGHQVADNSRQNWQAGIGYALPLASVDYAVLSLNLLEDRYAKNLGQDLPGHGHYFSPQRYRRIGPAFDVMTEEEKRFMLKGRASFGRTWQYEAAAPANPLTGGGFIIPAATGSGRAHDYELGSVWLATPSILIGGWASYRKSPDYRDRALMLFVNILFEPRRGVLSRDLPNTHAARLF